MNVFVIVSLSLHGTGNNGFIYYTFDCTHYPGTGTGIGNGTRDVITPRHLTKTHTQSLSVDAIDAHVHNLCTTIDVFVLRLNANNSKNHGNQVTIVMIVISRFLPLEDANVIA